jgi:serine O-acetyltransferase
MIGNPKNANKPYSFLTVYYLIETNTRVQKQSDGRVSEKTCIHLNEGITEDVLNIWYSQMRGKEQIMIKSKEDYLFFLEADRIALNTQKKRPSIFQDEIWKFQRCLRKVEFLENCNKNKLSRLQAKYKLHKLSVQLGFTIPPNVFGAGLSIAHRGPIVIHSRVRVGENCHIYHGVSIGDTRSTVDKEFPVIGNNVIICPYANISGPIVIADGIVVGANSYVNKSFTEPDITIAGCPAKKISNKSSIDMWIRATDILRKRKTDGFNRQI